jgi:hypothetical protein
VRVNRLELPLTGLSRLKDRSRSPFLPEIAVAAGERLLADFTRGQLQARATASWEPRFSDSAKGARGGMADLNRQCDDCVHRCRSRDGGGRA